MSSLCRVPSQVSETYKALPSSYDLDASTVEYLPRSRQVFHSHGRAPIRRRNYLSHVNMWICCNCGDGPKLHSVQSTCVQCHHDICGSCTEVKTDYESSTQNLINDWLLVFGATPVHAWH
ncbi:hypothetical protein BJY04DRAFT_222067 [Aspergillus karnatakaensis]|uniref:uncharacterized protein n=1 Tax=Aspergillus karnatakaensis TaxID=1810916 RepID=UPI003CCCF2E1